MPGIKALREAVKNCDASAALNALPALLDELETLRQRVNEDNEVCLCGCPPDAHECYEEDGESCENETHTCLRVCRSVAAEFEASQKALEAERIENAHLREAFVTMEKAYNEGQAELAALKARTCATCRHASHGDIDLWCTRWSSPIPTSSDVMCADILTCGAWAAKEQP